MGAQVEGEAQRQEEGEKEERGEEEEGKEEGGKEAQHKLSLNSLNNNCDYNHRFLLFFDTCFSSNLLTEARLLS